MSEEALSLFGDLDDFTEWKKEWREMPEFVQEDLQPFRSMEVELDTHFEKDGKAIIGRVIKVHFRNLEDMKLFGSRVQVSGINMDTKYFRFKGDLNAFIKVVDQSLTSETKSIWFPSPENEKPSSKRYFTDQITNPKYPVYIISKGRWESRLTSKALELMNIPYHIVVEPQEYDNYAEVINPDKIYTLPFSNLGLGGIPARNWVWEHSISIGAKRHWILDDNISSFCRLNRNTKIRVTSGVTFKVIEDFVDRYENIALSGMNYRFFAPQNDKQPPFRLNTRVYSCILIKNDIPYRWRGRYNEDTDLSIRALKDGYCTALFQTFLCDKMATMQMKGGNTDELYKDDGRLKMAQSLVDQHPDIVKVAWKWGRFQHHVNYDKFKQNKLVLKEGLKLKDEINNYGMELRNIQ